MLRMTLCQRCLKATPFAGNSLKLTFCALFVCTLFLEAAAESSCREFQLFDSAYHSYLSYRPGKAAEEFKLFLEEFPESSAKDAALFWLGKSLLQIQFVEEAKRKFAYVKEQFPASPFAHYVAKELEMIDSPPEKHGFAKGQWNEEGTQKLAAAALEAPAAGIGQQTFFDADIQNSRGLPAAGKTSAEKKNGGEGMAPVIYPSSGKKRSDKTAVYMLQVGAFKTMQSAMELRKNLLKTIPANKVAICQQGGFFKVRITGFNDMEEVNSVLNSGVHGLVIKTGGKACGI